MLWQINIIVYKDEFIITVDGQTLVQGKQYRAIRAIEDPQNAGLAKVIWDHDGRDFNPTGGQLAALLQLRDEDIRGEIQKLDTLAISFIDQVNEIHSQSYDLQGNTNRLFFEEFDYTNNVRGSFDQTGDGQNDSSLLFRIMGANQLQGNAQLGFEGTLTLSASNGAGLININYNSTDTVNQLIDRINLSGSEVLAGLNREGQLVLRASAAALKENPDFVIRHIEDSGQFLVGYAGVLNQTGADGAYDWQWNQIGGEDALTRLAVGEGNIQVTPVRNPAGWIRVNREIVEDASRLAAADGYYRDMFGAKNGTSATAISELNSRGPMVGQLKGYREFFSDMVADIGAKTRRAIDTARTEVLNLDRLTFEKESITGVNMDEELTDMLKFQHGYAAASRFVTEADKMIDIIINRMGV